MDANTTASVARSQAGRVRAIRKRNMGLLTRSVHKETLPTRTNNHSSPAKRTAENRLPGQPQVRAVVDEAIKHELAEARFVAPDLADHMFGHLVSVELAKDILERFVTDGVVEIRRAGRCLPPTSLDTKHALDAAFKAAKAHGCSPPTSEAQEQKTSTSSSARRRSKKQPKKPVTTKQASTSTSTSTATYSFRWIGYPSSPINEDKLVKFLNKITDLAWAAAKLKLDQSQFELKNRFAAPKDKKHAVPLAYEIDGEDMRPDFLVLPIEAFSTDHKTFDEKYINFTVPRAAGESKTTDFGSGLTQVHRYARGIRRAQPWVHFVVALTLTKEKMALLRGEGSGTERLELVLSGGQGCIEFIQIVLGLALASDEDLGQNSDVVLGSSEVNCKLTKPTPFPEVQKPAATSYRQTDPTTTTTASSSAPPEMESGAVPVGGYNTRSRTTQSSNATNRSVPPSYTGSSASKGSYSEAQLDDDVEEVEEGEEQEEQDEEEDEAEEEEEEEEEPSAKPTTTSSSSKRGHAEVDANYEDKEEPSRKKRAVYVDRVAFIPIVVYGYECLGILYTSSSIRGRGTTVFCVVDLEDESKLLALNMSWQDIAREAEQTEVMDKLRGQKEPHPNIVVPFRTFKASRKDKLCTTLGGIRDILEEHLAAFPVENRVLTIHVAELKRPTKYFWGVHDFVRGLRCAILGHAFLTKIGILHRDISENNIVLARRPWEERGYLIDFDMAILQDPVEEPPVTVASTDEEEYAAAVKSSSPIPPDETRPLRALRTGTTPYMSFSVLKGNKHTYYDDMESFLYVLLFFILSYAGPLSMQELQDAETRGFTHKLGSGPLSHVRSLPKRFNEWADGDLRTIADHKHASLAPKEGPNELIRTPEFEKCLKDNWPKELEDPVRFLLWKSWSLFANSRLQILAGQYLNHTQVSHVQFVQVLDQWLAKYGELEERFSNCPEFSRGT